MLTYFKINSEQALEWNEDLNDLTIFIVIIATVEHKFGFSTHIVSNRGQKGVSSRFCVLGYSTIKVIFANTVPENVEIIVVPDSSLRTHTIHQKVGDLDYRPVMTMTFSECAEWQNHA